MIDQDIAQWLVDGVLAQVGYQGSPDELREHLARHDRAVDQLRAIAYTPPAPPNETELAPDGGAVCD